MSRRTVFGVAAFVMIGSILACNLQSTQGGQPDFVATITAQAAALAQAGGTPANPQAPAPASTEVTAEVTATTNCRSGPGTAYNIVVSLNPGQKLKVVGQDTADNYWIVELPTGSGTCWLWGQYSTITGDPSGLPQMSPGAAPTPKATKTPKPPATNTPKPAGKVPSPPTNVDIGKISCDLKKTSLGTYNYEIRFYIKWTPSADPSVQGYHVYKDGQLLQSIGPGNIEYDDVFTITGVSAVSLPPVQHSYGVTAFNGNGESQEPNGSVSCN